MIYFSLHTGFYLTWGMWDVIIHFMCVKKLVLQIYQLSYFSEFQNALVYHRNIASIFVCFHKVFAVLLVFVFYDNYRVLADHNSMRINTGFHMSD